VVLEEQLKCRPYICLTQNYGANVPEKQFNEYGWNQQSKETIY